MRRTLATVLCVLTLAACGGGGDDPAAPCGSGTAERIAIEPGQGAVLLVRAIDVPARAAPWTMTATLDAHRFVESASGVSPPTAQGAVAAYHFLRVYRNGQLLTGLPRTDRDELLLPVAPGCHPVSQSERVAVQVEAGAAMRVEAVWSLVRPSRSAEDITAITESFSLLITEQPL